MKKSILAFSIILLSISSLSIFAEKNSPTPLKSGDKLTLSDFKTTNAGIKYKITKVGSGDKPVFGETLTVHYTGHLLQGSNVVGSKFDSSVTRNQPFQFKLGARQVISGWEMSLSEMQTGEERIVILPSKLAYGNRATGTIPSDSTLVFEIKLIKTS